MSQIVKHTSRGLDYVLNFTTTENITAIDLQAVSDGDIFDVVLVNVASYTIDSNTIVLPFSLVDNIYYNVAITKTTNGQPASITFKTRRAIDKIITKPVFDIYQYMGRYLYIVNTLNQIEKHDLTLRQPANYIGDGVWDGSSLLETITLPTLPTNGHWCHIEFTPVNGVEMFTIFGDLYSGGNVLHRLFVCKMIDGVCYSLNNVQNAYTETLTGLTNAVDYRQNIYTAYDYINYKLFIFYPTSTAYYYLLDYNLTYPTLVQKTAQLTSNDSLQQLFLGTYANKATLLPDDGLFITSGLIYPENNYKGQYLGLYNLGAYDIESQHIIQSQQGAIASTVLKLDKKGNLYSNMGPSPVIAGNNTGHWNYSNYLKQGFCRTALSPTNYAIYSKTNNTFGVYVVQNDISTPSRLKHLACSNHANLWVFSKAVVNASTRIHHVQIGQSPPNFAYEDFANGVRSFITNQLNI